MICVVFTGDTGSRDAALQQCSHRNASLPEPRSREANDQLAEFAGDKRIWLGISDYVDEGEWRYLSDNASVYYENWGGMMPFGWNRDDDCAVLVGNKKTLANDGNLADSGKWYDRSCLAACEDNSIVCAVKTTP